MRNLFTKELSKFPEGYFENLSAKERYNIISKIAMDSVHSQIVNEKSATEKRACYFSAEFLIGRMVYSNLLNLGLYDQATKAMEKVGLNINEFEDIEDLALGNGGLGRLAACFLDSGASVGVNLDGYGIRYKYGIFKQAFENGFQKELPDNWQRFGDPWSIRQYSDDVVIEFGDSTVIARAYDMPVFGYENGQINNLRLWEAASNDPFDFAEFDKGNYLGSIAGREFAERISRVLYPNDNSGEGKELRFRQQYFFSSASLQDILKRFEKITTDYTKLPDYFSIQLNDTHPVISIPELIRLLGLRGVSFDDALDICKKVFAYTNHTVMSEALEKWHMDLIEKVTPKLVDIIKHLHHKMISEVLGAGISHEELPAYDIIDYHGMLHMANLACYVGFAVNGVAAVHTEIIKADTLKQWYKIYPSRFYNKTNGITQRRWLKLCNKKLSQFISKRIGDEWITDLDQLEKLEEFATDEATLTEFMDIKHANKQRLCDYIYKKEGIKLNPDFIFDIQIKRMHEYKRQLLNALSIIHIYLGLKDGSITDFTPTAFIFGAKSAPGYYRAKGIIKLIHEIANKVNNDPEMDQLLKVVYVTDYNVSYAENLISAADVSEQISTAGTEASGTGNMKMMLNGTVTLGTLDGANIEIVAAAGEENNYIFGEKVEYIADCVKFHNPRWVYDNKPHIRRVLNTLVDGTFNDNNSGMFNELFHSLLDGSDWEKADKYYLLGDFDSYIEAKTKVNQDYKDTLAFAEKSFANCIHAGRFSSDRTIREYAKEIWKL